MGIKFQINPDIRKAHTLPSSFYRDKDTFEECKEKIFAKSWQFVSDTGVVKIPGQAYPFNFLDGYIDEPLILTRDQNDKIHCLSNVCTHRGNTVVEAPCNLNALRCRYHGRRFELDGKFKSMPEFKDCEDFPTEADNLSKVNFEEWNGFIFVSLDPSHSLKEYLKPIEDRLSWFPFDRLKFEPSRSRDYLVKANWALYCDNYLEGFHIPFVHSGLNATLDYGQYENEIYDYCNLQLGISDKGEDTFDLPKDSPDHGKDVSAYYYWVFPNMMFNFYPWGLSINIVRPISFNLTKVSFLTYVSDPGALDKGAGAELDKVEREDEEIVEMVQKGINSRYYKSGRYSPKMEQGVHHFHRLLAEFLG